MTEVNRMDKLEAKVEKHENRLVSLEVADATIIQQVKDLCKSVDGLVETIKWGMGGLIAVSIGILTIYFSVKK